MRSTQIRPCGSSEKVSYIIIMTSYVTKVITNESHNKLDVFNS